MTDLTPPEPQPWTQRRRAIWAALVASAVCSLILAGAAAVRDVGWPHAGALGLSLGSLVLILGGYMREARGERADYLANLSKHIEAVGKAVSAARGGS